VAIRDMLNTQFYLHLKLAYGVLQTPPYFYHYSDQGKFLLTHYYPPVRPPAFRRRQTDRWVYLVLINNFQHTRCHHAFLDFYVKYFLSSDANLATYERRLPDRKLIIFCPLWMECATFSLPSEYPFQRLQGLSL
jgi:hypothetical protein